MDELVIWIWLSDACEAGTNTFKRLWDSFGGVKAIYEADAADLSGVVDSKSRIYNSLLNKKLGRAEAIYKFCKRYSVGMLVFDDPAYPDALKKTSNPPAMLFYRGVLPDFNKDCFISMVGTRHLSEYGKRNTFSIAKDLSASGAHIVSGMAIGIDGVALAGAIAGGTPTVAVLGCGIDICYPSSHLTLAREIVKKGCILTEYLPKTRPNRYNFPKRNRIMSGISSSVIVMEGRERSGAIITAHHAKEQGRRVYAFPGNVGNANSEATNLLIKNGASLITSADDVIANYKNPVSAVLNPFNMEKAEKVDMTEWLYTLKVSCVTDNDKIFRPFAKSHTKNKKDNSDNKITKDTLVKSGGERDNSISRPDINKELIALYKKIPVDGDCTVESLVDEEHSLVDVMQGLLKLEIGGFVKVLPGDRVKRNL